MLREVHQEICWYIHSRMSLITCSRLEHPPASRRGESIVSITLTYPQQDVIYNLLQIGAPPERRGGGMVYIRLCGSYFVDRTLGYIHISTLPLVGFLKNSSERHITFEIFCLSSILDFHLKRFEFSCDATWLLLAAWRQPMVCSWGDKFHVSQQYNCCLRFEDNLWCARGRINSTLGTVSIAQYVITICGVLSRSFHEMLD